MIKMMTIVIKITILMIVMITCKPYTTNKHKEKDKPAQQRSACGGLVCYHGICLYAKLYDINLHVVLLCDVRLCYIQLN